MSIHPETREKMLRSWPRGKQVMIFGTTNFGDGLRSRVCLGKLSSGLAWTGYFVVGEKLIKVKDGSKKMTCVTTGKYDPNNKDVVLELTVEVPYTELTIEAIMVAEKLIA